MLFATATLAARIERAEYRMARDFAEAARARCEDVLVAPIGGAAAIFGGHGKPFNKVAGLGFGEPVDEETLSGIEREFDARGEPLRVELCALADPLVGPMLTQRGYALVGFENLLGLELTDSLAARLLADVNADRSRGIVVSRVAKDDLHTWVDVVVTGFEHPDVFDGPATQETFPREALEHVFQDWVNVPGLVAFLAHRQEVVAGGGSMRIFDSIAQLCGAATLPEHRRQGIQSALLRARLIDAAQQGCALAVVTTQPASKSQENVQGAGFTLLYTRAILVREPRRDAGY
jgi:ribosomal protein S18 acetylase RimI-like enzyme